MVVQIRGMKYEKSHPWIRFFLNVAASNYRFWLQLGEIASKVEHLSGVPIHPAFSEEMYSTYVARGAHASTAIEGNTLSEEQVRAQVDGELEVPPSQAYLKQEVQNVIKAYDTVVETAGTKAPLSTRLLKLYNELILFGLDVEDGVVPGELRKRSVIVGNVYRGAPPEDCEYLLDRLCEWLNGPDFEAPEEDLRVPFAVIKAIVAHIYLAWIHPFGDGNGRTARLVEFHILYAGGVPFPAAHLLSDHYNRTRSRYYRELDRASKSGGETMPFLRYAVQGFIDGLREQIDLVKEQHFNLAWEHHLHEMFSGKGNSSTQTRRRELVLELSKHRWIQVSAIVELSAKLARLYALAGDRMLQRDLNAVKNMGLVEREYGKVRARTEMILAFLPERL